MLYKSIGQNILIIEKYMKLYLKNTLKRYNLKTAEGMILLVLYGNNGVNEEELLKNLCERTQEQLIDELHYDKGVMTRTMKSLEKKKFVTRRISEQDGRSYLFQLTDKAYQFKPILIEILQIWSDCILQNLSTESIHIVDEGLKKMADSAKMIVKGKVR